MRIAILALAISICFGSSLPAQTISDDQHAALIVDFNVEKMKKSKLAQTLNLGEQWAKAASLRDNPPFDASKVKRTVIAMSAPKNVVEVKMMIDGKMPAEFYGRLQFVDASAAKNAFGVMQAKHTAVEINGKTYYKPEDRPNILMHRVDDTTIEIATESYAFLPNRDVLSQGLQDAWAKTGDDSIRVAIDVEAASELINEAVEMGKARAKGTPQEAMTVGYLDLIDNMKNLRLGIDFSNDNLLTIQATGVDEKQAKELQGGLDAILGMGKMMGGMQLQGLQEQDPEAGAVIGQILNALNANREGTEVDVTIPHPEGLEALAAKFAPMLGIAPPSAAVESAPPSGLTEPVPVP